MAVSSLLAPDLADEMNVIFRSEVRAFCSRSIRAKILPVFNLEARKMKVINHNLAGRT